MRKKKKQRPVYRRGREVRTKMRNKPKQDGSGRGTRANRGRGGCTTTKKKGQGSNRK